MALFWTSSSGASAATDAAPTGEGLADYGDGTLFKEIGHTLDDVARQTLQGTASSLRTAIARQIVGTQEGAQVAQQQTVTSWLPVVIIGIIVFVLFGKFFRV